MDSFDRQYAKLKAFCDEDSAARAEQLRSYIDNAPSFDAHSILRKRFSLRLTANSTATTPHSCPRPWRQRVGGAVAAASFVAEPFADFDFDARLDPSETLDDVDALAEEPTSADVTQFMQPVNDEESFTLDF